MNLSFAIIGCGKIAPRHANEAGKHGILTAVCDIIPERADLLAQQFNARPYYSIEDLLKNESPSVVAVCTPNGLHAEHSILALENGSHVLCEKPLSISSKDSEKMISAARTANRKLFVVKSTRYNPALIKLKEFIDGNNFGRLYSFQMNCFWNRPPAYYENTWRGSMNEDGGTLFTQFSHYIDALLWLAGDIRNLSGFRNNAAHQGIIAFEDSGVVAVEMENGMIGGINWSVNTYQKNMEVSLTMIGEKGSIRIGGEYMNQVEYQVFEDTMFTVPADGGPNDYGFYKGSMSNHGQVYDNMIKAITNDQHPFTYGEEGLKTVRIIERIYNTVSLS